MLENPRSERVKAIAKLRRRARRAEAGLFLVEGPNAVAEALEYRAELVVEFYATQESFERHPELAAAAIEAGADVEVVSESVLARMTDTVNPQGVLAVCTIAPTRLDEAIEGLPSLLVVLDQVRDPGNLGTIIRVADAAGADAVILTGDTVDLYNPKTVRASTGSIFHLPVVADAELGEVAERLSALGVTLLAAAMDGDDLRSARADGTLERPSAWLFGNEAHGLDDAARSHADRVLAVPLYGRAESLNLASAAAVCLYESALAQRALPPT